MHLYSYTHEVCLSPIHVHTDDADAIQLDSCVASAVCIGHNIFKYMPMLPYTATTLSQHLVPRDSESPTVPSKFHNLGGQQKIFFRR